jgi:tetrahydromethanopterin S-methyltransferase subunit B
MQKRKGQWGMIMGMAILGLIAVVLALIFFREVFGV